jgi:hypothetical protein
MEYCSAVNRADGRGVQSASSSTGRFWRKQPVTDMPVLRIDCQPAFKVDHIGAYCRPNDKDCQSCFYRDQIAGTGDSTLSVGKIRTKTIIKHDYFELGDPGNPWVALLGD